jgi:hypothetical protein
MSFMRHRRDKGATREVPQWKLAMMDADASSPSPPGGGAKRAREEEPREDDGPTRRREADQLGDGPRGAIAIAPAAPVLPTRDDDDDEHFDPRIYGASDDEEAGDDGEAAAAAAAAAPGLTLEQQLLMREARDGKKRARIFFLEDQEASLVKSLGGQRSEQRREMHMQGRGFHGSHRGGMGSGGRGGARG